MFRMEVYEAGKTKGLIITTNSIADCLSDLKDINDGIRRIAEEEPTWTGGAVWGYKGCKDVHAEVHNKPIKTISSEELNSL